MTNFKKILALVLVVAISVGAGIMGTLAYLTSEDSDVNVMTMGNVTIDQLEYERVVDENGNWVPVDTSSVDPNYGYAQADELKEFTQNKPALPAVYRDGEVKWDDRTAGHQQLWNQVGAPGSNQLFDDSVKNVVDKFVFVKNTGLSNAYYRTIIAIECPEGLAPELIHINANDNARFDWEDIGYTTIGGSRYLLKVATYNEILKPKEVSRPSLLQVFLDPKADNEDVVLFGDTWEILVFSQAIQSDGFENAAQALQAGFDVITTTNHPWNIKAATGAELTDALNDQLPVQNVQLTGDAVADNYFNAAENSTAIELDGKTLGATYIENEGSLTIENGNINSGTPSDYSVISLPGSETTLNNVDIVSEGGGIGAVDGAQVTINSGSVAVNTTSTSGRYNVYAVGDGTVVTINGGEFSFSKTLNQKRAYVYAGAGATVYINGGTFGAASTRDGYTAGILGNGTVIITGGTFGFDPSTWVAEGYEAVQNGSTWTVSPKA